MNTHINKDTPEQIKINHDLKQVGWNLIATFRTDTQANSDYNALNERILEDTRILSLFNCNEGNAGEHDLFHSHVLIKTLDVERTIDWIDTCSSEISDVWLKEYELDQGEIEGYVKKFIGNEGVTYDRLEYHLYHRYQNQDEVIEKLEELAGAESFNQEEICNLVGITRATWYRDIDRYDITGKYRGRKKYYPRDTAEAVMIKRKVLKPCDRLPVSNFDRRARWERMTPKQRDLHGFSSGSRSHV